MIDNGSTSDFVALGTVDVSEHFSEMEEIPTKGFNVLVRAKRFGQWWMLKGLKSEYRQDLAYQELLSKEYDILTRVQHPNVIAVEGMEEVDGYGRCIVMEWVDGDTLAEWLERPHSNLEKRNLIGQLLDAVEYIHRCQVVHRDLKPNNIMVTRNGQHVKLIDFGLADTDNYAIFKQPAGTDGFISPEQLSNSTPDSRNDIYSLGSILLLMRMGWKYRHVAHRCHLSIECRYADVLSIKEDLKKLGRLQIVGCILLLLVALVGGGTWGYRHILGPKQMYEVVADFKVGYLRYCSWGGGLVSVVSTTDIDSCIEIPREASYTGITYQMSEIARGAFKNHHRLRRVILPNAKLSVLEEAFKGCDHLREIYFRSKMPPQIGNFHWDVRLKDVFEPYHFTRVILYVPKGSVGNYRDSEWGQFLHIQEYG